MEHKKVTTSIEVYAVIRAKHGDELQVFSSYSAPDGDYYGNPDQGRMFTEWGFKGAECPIYGSEHRWDIDRDKPHNRNNQTSEYWLCIPVGE